MVTRAKNRKTFKRHLHGQWPDFKIISMSAYITSRYYKPYLSSSPRDRPSKERQLGKKNCLKQTIARPSCPPYQASCCKVTKIGYQSRTGSLPPRHRKQPIRTRKVYSRQSTPQACGMPNACGRHCYSKE